jgi:hypothetical protein
MLLSEKWTRKRKVKCVRVYVCSSWKAKGLEQRLSKIALHSLASYYVLIAPGNSILLMLLVTIKYSKKQTILR